MDRFYRLVFAALLTVWAGTLLGGGLFALGHAFHTAPGVILGVFTAAVVMLGALVIGLGPVRDHYRHRR